MPITDAKPTLYPAINAVLHDLLNRVRDILDDRFIGLYLCGSLVTGDFQARRSDIDFVAVTDDHLPDTLIAALEAMHVNLDATSPWANRLEGAYVPKNALSRYDPTYPPIPMINERKFYRERLWADSIIQRHELRTYDVRIAGPSLRDLIEPVEREHLRMAVVEVLRKWWEPLLRDVGRLHDYGYQPYAVLTMCRTLYTLETGAAVSKSEAAEWALASLPQEWSPLIRHAKAWRSGEETGNVDVTKELIRHVVRRAGQ